MSDSWEGRRISRRRFGALAAGLAGPFVLGCRLAGAGSGGAEGRITARPRPATKTTASGTHALGLSPGRDAVLQMPSKPGAGAVPLIVLLHGAGGSADRLLARFGAAADAAGIAVLAPDSRESTWDAIRGSFDADVAFLNRALDRVFGTVAVDPERLAVGGFSDGATYALSLGLINGDLFRRVVAFSPGFVVDGETHGHPRFFVSHGTADPILPIERCSRVIVPTLRRRGYDVTFREFEGGHEVPAPIAAEGMGWTAGGQK